MHGRINHVEMNATCRRNFFIRAADEQLKGGGELNIYLAAGKALTMKSIAITFQSIVH